MTRRGRILRDAATGPGLLVVDDNQLAFTLERMWKAATPPAVGMVVDVEVEGSTVLSVSPVPDGRLAREHAERALIGARRSSAALFRAAESRFGLPAVIAGVALVVGWFVLTAGSFATPLGRTDFTFWQVLRAVNSGGGAMIERMASRGGSPGLYGFIALGALAGPFILPIWKDRRAHLAGTLPLLLMLVIAWKVWHLADPSTSETEGVDAALVKSFADGVRDEIRRSISLGFGAYVSIAAALYIAAISVRKYLTR